MEATVDQNGDFWVKKDLNGDTINGCLKWTGTHISVANCDDKLSVVFQKNNASYLQPLFTQKFVLVFLIFNSPVFII